MSGRDIRKSHVPPVRRTTGRILEVVAKWGVACRRTSMSRIDSEGTFTAAVRTSFILPRPARLLALSFRPHQPGLERQAGERRCRPEVGLPAGEDGIHRSTDALPHLCWMPGTAPRPDTVAAFIAVPWGPAGRTSGTRQPRGMTDEPDSVAPRTDGRRGLHPRTATAQVDSVRLATATAQAKQKLGLIVYPAKGQTPTQQANDEQPCYAWAQQQIDPLATAPNPDSAAQGGKARADTATQGAALKGAAGGLAGGVLVGAVAGDAGTGAKVGDPRVIRPLRRAPIRPPAQIG
jgi:hypothetical protein